MQHQRNRTAQHQPEQTGRCGIDYPACSATLQNQPFGGVDVQAMKDDLAALTPDEDAADDASATADGSG